MRVLSRSTLREFWKRHAGAEQPLKAWFAEAVRASWKRPQHVRNEYPSASFVADNRIVFNIAGNKYRLVVHVNYHYQTVYIKFIGTHAEYERIDVEKV
jgi:mRNA interferase HigB